MTPQDTSPATAARGAIQSLLRGNPPNGVTAAMCGPWAGVLTELYSQHSSGGPAAVRAAWNAICRTNQAAATLIAADVTSEARSTNAPALPVEAQGVYQHLAPCGHWLEQYIDFAMQAAPMTPRSFHEAAGLFAVSMAVARRLMVKKGVMTFFPNVYFLFVSPSTIDHKSTGLKVIEHIIAAAGLGHLLMAKKGSPQAIVADLDSGKLPTARQMQDIDSFLQRRAFAAQRGWLREEASALFASLKQEYNTGLLELILELYDCPERYEEMTISRGETSIQRAALSFFGLSNPVDMAPHFANMGYWSNGLWARCTVVTPDSGKRDFVFFPDRIEGGAMLSLHLKQIYGMFATPRAELKELTDAKGSAQPYIEITNAAPPDEALLAPGVGDAWEAYAKATGYTLLHGGNVDQELWACYGRFGTLAIKVAQLLAVMDTERLPVVVGLHHFARAQQMVEGWRAKLHHIWEEQSTTTEGRLTQRVMERLKKATAGVTKRDLCMSLREGSKQISEALDLLAQAGKVTNAATKGGNGRSIETWHIAIN